MFCLYFGATAEYFGSLGNDPKYVEPRLLLIGQQIATYPPPPYGNIYLVRNSICYHPGNNFPVQD